jgi:basic membrane protein A
MKSQRCNRRAPRAGLLAAGLLALSWQQAAARDVQVAYIPCGQVNDGSWSEAGYDGMKQAKAALAAAGIDMKLEYSENLSPSQAETAARDYASRGFQTVVLHCGTFADAAYNAGKSFPKTNFLIVVAPRSVGNVWTYIPAMQDISFVAGYLAAKVSKASAVGVVASYNFSNVTWQAEGFRLGARYANPAIQTFETYINSFDDAGKAKEAAQAEIDSGADVIYSATDQASRGIYAATAAAGDYAIASYTDQNSLAPKTVLASATADIPLLVRTVVVGSVEDKLEPGKPYSVGMAGGIGALTLNEALAKGLPAAVVSDVTALMGKVRSGEMRIPAISTPGGYKNVDLAGLAPH